MRDILQVKDLPMHGPNDCAPVCFVHTENIGVTPYFERYQKCATTPFDIIYWDRSGTGNCEVNAAESFVFKHRVNTSTGKRQYPQLLTGYLGFARYAKNLILKRPYKRVVCLTGNTAAILNGVLSSVYDRRYIVDIRDYFLEGLKPYFKAEQKALAHAGLIIASSPAYKTFIGDHDFLLMHNDQTLPQTFNPAFPTYDRKDPFVIACIGTIKNIELDKRIIDYFANDNRFELRFIGRGYEALLDYETVKRSNNVIVEGAFPSELTLSKYDGVHAILNMYGNHHPHFDYALSNKLYFSARLQKPILVCPDTYMAEMANRYSLGIAVDLESDAAKENILALYQPELLEKRMAGACEFIAMVEDDNEKAETAIRSFLSIENPPM